MWFFVKRAFKQQALGLVEPHLAGALAAHTEARAEAHAAAGRALRPGLAGGLVLAGWGCLPGYGWLVLASRC